MNKWGYIKLKSIWIAKETITRLKRQPAVWKKIFARYLFNEDLISRINRTLKKLSLQIFNTPMKKWVYELNREFSKEEVQMASKFMKKCSNSLVIIEMQVKTTLRFHLTPVRMVRIKCKNNNKCW
jgi:hypothetical protein